MFLTEKTFKTVAIIGASGAIGQAFTTLLSQQTSVEKTYAFSRHPIPPSEKIVSHAIDLMDEDSIANAASKLDQTPPDLILVTTGMLHDQNIQPEKSLKDLRADNFQTVFAINTIGPALIAKHFLAACPHDYPVVFAALSARVGSIQDNRLGGWYTYRASKAALNMILKTVSIEIHHRNKQAIVVGLHPGTVNSQLSKPFQANVPADKLFTPEFSATQLLNVINNLKVEDSGKTFAWDGSEIPY